MGKSESQIGSRHRVILILLNVATLLVLWLALRPWMPHPSERFYLVVPWVFAAGALWRAILRMRRAAVVRALASAGMLAAIIGVALYERRNPVDALIPGELTELAKGMLAVFIVCSWGWTGVSAAINPLFRVRAGSKLAHRLVARAGTILVFSVIVTGYLMAVLQTHFPKRRSDVTPRMLHRDFDVVRFASRDGLPLVGWFVPSGDSDRVAVVCHGVGAYKADMLDFIEALAQGGYNVLAFDFRGHGESGGHTISYGKYEQLDVLAAVDWLRENHPERSRRVVGVAWSMGAASLILAAADDTRIEALHIDAAYARTRDVARVIAAPFPPVYEQCSLAIGLALSSLESGANLYTIAPVEVIADIAPRPIMIVHGAADPLILLEQGKALFAAAREPKQFVIIPGAGHCQTIAADTPEYQRRMIAFLDAAIQKNPRP